MSGGGDGESLEGIFSPFMRKGMGNPFAINQGIAGRGGMFAPQQPNPFGLSFLGPDMPFMNLGTLNPGPGPEPGVPAVPPVIPAPAPAAPAAPVRGAGGGSGGGLNRVLDSIRFNNLGQQRDTYAWKEQAARGIMARRKRRRQARFGGR